MLDPLYQALFEECYTAERRAVAFATMPTDDRRHLYEKMGRGHLEFWRNKYQSLMRLIVKGHAQEDYEWWKGELTMTDYKYINTGESIRLRRLIISGDINDDALIEIYDASGYLCTKGEWYRDWVLAHLEHVGVAWKPGSGRTIHFKLKE